MRVPGLRRPVEYLGGSLRPVEAAELLFARIQHHEPSAVDGEVRRLSKPGAVGVALAQRTRTSGPVDQQTVAKETDMTWGTITRKSGATLATGVVGVAAVEVLKRWGAPLLARRSVVTATALGLRGVRAAEAGAENVRLYSADILAEAREQVGETAPPPAGTTGGEHGHDH